MSAVNHTYQQLVTIGLEMGMTAESAAEMADEHIMLRDEKLPRYVRIDLNASTGKVTARVAKFLDRKFGWNAENVHRIFGLHINRDKTSNWYVTT